MVEAQRFCRKCGSASELEAETRELDRQRSSAAPTEPVGHQQTTPAVFTPGGLLNVPAGMPQPASPPAHNRNLLIVIVAVIGLLFLLVLAVGGFFLVSSFSRPAVPAVEVPTVPAMPPAPPPPPPPPPPNIDVDSSESSLRYPGSETLFSTSDRGKHVMSLRTSAPFSTVRDWYEQRMSSPKKVSLPGSVILTSKDTAVVIASEGQSTTIVV